MGHSILLILGILGMGTLASADNNEEDYYTSIVSLQELARREQEIVKAVTNYRKLLTERLDLIDGYIAEYKSSLISLGFSKFGSSSLQKFPRLARAIKKERLRGHSVPLFQGTDELNDLANYFSSHPTLAYKIIRRLGKEFAELVKNLDNEIETDLVKLADRLANEIRVPNEEDLNGAANGLLRVQAIHEISTNDFIAGLFGDNRNVDSSLLTSFQLSSAFDMYFIGSQALAGNQFSYAVQWFYKALGSVMHKHDKSLTLDVAKEGLEFALLKHDETFDEKDDLSSQLFFKRKLGVNITNIRVPKSLVRPKRATVLNYEDERWEDFWNFQALCSGADLLGPEKKKGLHCYLKKDSPLTLISPVGVEVHLKEPFTIIQFYDIIREPTINILQELASPNLKRSRVLGTPNDKNVKSDIRTSTNTWINENLYPQLAKIPAIIKDLTGLDAVTGFAAEDLQVSSYGGIGGHYQPHIDPLFDPMHAPFVAAEEKFRGDRISTMMFYLSDVELGGWTAFPRLGVAVRPLKGSAVFWNNLKRNGERDLKSLHGGCPVGQGIKWVANKWIRSTQQMFHRPCALDPKV